MEDKTRQYSFAFTREEAIDYYTYLLSSTRSSRLKQFFIMFSVPLVMLLSYYFFKVTNITVRVIMAAVSIIWVVMIVPRFWKAYTSNNIGEKFLEKNNLTEFPQVNVTIRYDTIIVDGKEYDLYDLKRIVKTELLTIFFFPGQPIALPNRIID